MFKLTIYTRSEQVFFGGEEPPQIKVRRTFLTPERAFIYLYKWVTSPNGESFVCPDAEITNLDDTLHPFELDFTSMWDRINAMTNGRRK